MQALVQISLIHRTLGSLSLIWTLQRFVGLIGAAFQLASVVRSCEMNEWH